LEYPTTLNIVEDKLYVKPIGNKKVDGEYGKYWVKAKYLNGSGDLENLSKVFAWYITEGHVNNSHAIISQNKVDVLNKIKLAAESVSSSKASLQNRSDKEDKTSRLHLSTRVWRELLEYNCGKYSENKKIPDFVFNLEKGLLKKFFYELIDGDGTRKPSNKSIKSAEYLEKCFRYKTTMFWFYLCTFYR